MTDYTYNPNLYNDANEDFDDQEYYDIYIQDEQEPLPIPPSSSADYNYVNSSFTIFEISKNPYMVYFKSKHILIGDIDCGERTLMHLCNIMNYACTHDASFRVYRTLNGLRFFRMDAIYQCVNRSALTLLKTLNCDPKYVKFCARLGHFSARLTPKLPGHDSYYHDVVNLLIPPVRICEYLDSYSSGIKFNRTIAESVQLHDRLTGAKFDGLELV